MRRASNIFVTLVVCSCLVITSTLFAGDDQDKVLTSFESHIKELKTADAKAQQSAIEAVSQLKSESASDAMTEALILLYPEYEKAIESTEGDDSAASIELLGKFADSADKFLAADASFYLARTMMNVERFEQALPLLNRLGREMDSYSVNLPTVQYYRGVALAGLLQNKEAETSFMEFLQFNPDAPERLRVNAWRQVQQLQATDEGKMEEVHQKMDYSRRRLRLTESDEQTQGEQEKIVKLLTKMIKEQEKKECSSSNSKSDKPNTKKQQQKSPQQQAKNKPKPSKGQQGGSSSNPNGEVVNKTYDDSPTSPWSRLRDRSRDPANNAIKEKLPARYRDIVERYYEAANGNGSKK